VRNFEKLAVVGNFDLFMDTLNKSGVFVSTLSDKLKEEI
jgi:hypothetical protein